jgi:hypothetical protein
MKKRAYFEARPSIVKNSIQDGNRRAITEAGETLRMVHDAMHYEYKYLLGGDYVVAK